MLLWSVPSLHLCLPVWGRRSNDGAKNVSYDPSIRPATIAPARHRPDQTPHLGLSCLPTDSLILQIDPRLPTILRSSLGNPSPINPDFHYPPNMLKTIPVSAKRLRQPKLTILTLSECDRRKERKQKRLLDEVTRFPGQRKSTDRKADRVDDYLQSTTRQRVTTSSSNSSKGYETAKQSAVSTRPLARKVPTASQPRPSSVVCSQDPARAARDRLATVVGACVSLLPGPGEKIRGGDAKCQARFLAPRPTKLIMCFIGDVSRARKPARLSRL